jgi:type VI secretion system protein ImpL
VREAACRLQQRWELDVLAKVAGAPRSKRDEVLFDDSEGVVWEFANETMTPFAVRTTNGYAAVKSEDYPIPFKPRLFRFLNAAAEGVLTHQPEYVVTLEAMPIQVNPDAIDEPYESVVSVQCADGPVYLENRNYPRSLTFKWHPDRCGDVSVRIMFSRLVLTKFYSGELGLAHFLRDFRDGTHTYAVEDFPRYKEHLSNRGIEWIRLTYRVEGAEPVIQLLKTMPGDMPREIVECWEEQLTRVAEGS